MPLLNWTPDKGQSYDYPHDWYLVTEPSWKILEGKEVEEILDYFENHETL